MSQIVSFDEWTEGREIERLTTNFGTPPIAFQKWRSFKEAFAPELVKQAYNETSAILGRQVTSCIDPFGGSGTTALACQFLGVTPLTIEVNPYLADLIAAKLTSYNIESLIVDFEKVMDKRGRPNSRRPYPNAPKTFVEPGDKGRYIFSLAVARRFESIRRRIDSLHNTNNRRILRVLLASISVDCSNVVVSGKGRRYRSNWETRETSPARVDELFSAKVYSCIYEIQRYSNRLTLQGEVFCGDARTAVPTRRRFDMAVFSPPYPNSFDYTDVYNVELWVSGYLKDMTSNRDLRESTLRSHVQIKRPFCAVSQNSEKLRKVYWQLDKVRTGLWNKHIPEMVTSYFDDMTKVIARLSACLRDRAQCYIVVGDSQYNSVHVPVGEIIKELAESVNLSIVESKPYRSMRAAPQQGGRTELVEQLLTFRRAPRT